jgi:hypothetical protein
MSEPVRPELENGCISTFSNKSKPARRVITHTRWTEFQISQILLFLALCPYDSDPLESSGRFIQPVALSIVLSLRK